MEGDFEVGVGVADGDEVFGYGDGDVEFFFDFAADGGLDFFVFFLLAAGEFPEASEQAIGLAPVDQEFIFFPDDADTNVIMGDRWAFDFQG